MYEIDIAPISLDHPRDDGIVPTIRSGNAKRSVREAVTGEDHRLRYGHFRR
jgi:hypothetical protein